MHVSRMIPLIFTGILCLSSAAHAAGSPVDKVLPAPACAQGWIMDGNVTYFDRDNLFERVNGESELYFPYGFERLASARYVNGGKPQTGFDADVYTMGSLLDAFGMYANYRSREDAGAKIGAEGTLSGSQLFFYQDRYLVRLQATGATVPGRDVFLDCGRAISGNLPVGAGRPRELELFAVPSVVPRSERYIASSLLGYDFFRRGVISDALPGGGQAQLFLVIEDSRSAARNSFDLYRAYLKASGKDPQVSELPDRASLQGVDPLYGMVMVVQTGRYIIGVVKFTDAAAASQLVEQFRIRLGSGWEK